MQRKEHGEGKRTRKKEETEETPGIRKTSQRADRTGFLTESPVGR